MPQPQDAEILHTARFLELRRSGRWEYVQRCHAAGGAAFMIATTQDQELVLVEQLRPAVDQRVIELPAGVVGDEHPDEAPIEAAKRELEEETGFRPGQVECLHDSPTAAGLTSEWAWYFRMTQLKRVAAGGGVDGEDITTHVVALNGIEAWLGARKAEGKAVDWRIFAALHWIACEADSTPG